ncbi:NADPH:quinone reductase [Pantoea ananatis]|uniref:NADPH:quinone reductase n=1 Tax=Pantoea ananas TaxID=553 RepID=UPI000E27DFCB|nr:NADPH:quinone reductase [Pantoea ananatis]NCU09221.1 zinc-binding dehydrogenase [Pantoea ananatis]REE66431.1 NADPH:quinone reductase-like Zn-dependent oxidoreductase [Pantoea ananatis]BBL31026.1 alcohol dehydrogenase [Pantoea ananatis]
MKAAYYDIQGNAHDVLKIGEVSKPSPGPNEVLVRIYVSGINPSDIKARTGFSASMPYARIIPHQDGAGVIEAVGENVSSERLNERVWIYEAQYGRASGTAAEFVVVPTSQAVRLPDNVSFETGASLGIPALTAHRCLFSDGDLKDRRVLIHGGAGVVGTAAILLAKWAGAWVVTTVRNARQAAIAKINGADLVLDHTAGDVANIIMANTDNQGVHHIVDVALKENLDINLACLTQGGVISSYATSSATETISVPLLKAMMHGCVLRFVYIYKVPMEVKKVSAEDINSCLETGSYAPLIGLNLPLENIADAHHTLEHSNVIGKVLIHI